MYAFEYDYENTSTFKDDESTAPCRQEETWLFASRFTPVSYLLVFILALVGNVLVLCVIRRYRQSRHSPCSFSLTDTFLLHLAISDLLLALTLPFFAVEWMNEWIFGWFVCKLAGALFSLNLYCGVLFLACISFDRYLAIVHAINISWRRKTCHAQLACAVIWVTCLGLAIVDVRFRDVKELHGNGKSVCQMVFSYATSQQWQVGLQFTSLFLGFVLPLLVMLYCYLRIFKALCNTTPRRQKRRPLRLIISLVVVFVVSWAPYNILRTTDSLLTLGFLKNTCHLKKVLEVGIVVTESLGLAHCALNPLLYGLVGIKFRRELALMCKTVLGPKVRSGSAKWSHGWGSTRRATGSFSSVESENTSYFSAVA
nr:C-X-C chemokine receptor type 3-2 [Misgurnus anguillicaudatus]